MTEHDDELDLLTRRLESAEAEAARLRDSLGQVAREAIEAREAVLCLEVENRRLLASLNEEQRQRRAIEDAAGTVVGACTLDELLRHLRQIRQDAMDHAMCGPLGRVELAPVSGSALAQSVALPRPEDLPAGYLFRVLQWGMDHISSFSKGGYGNE